MSDIAEESTFQQPQPQAAEQPTDPTGPDLVDPVLDPRADTEPAAAEVLQEVIQVSPPLAPVPGLQKEPVAEVPSDAPPTAPLLAALQPVAHVRIGGGAGVRVTQLGGVTVSRAGQTQDLEHTSLRVSREKFEQLATLLAGSSELLGDELAEQVAALFTEELVTR